MADSKAEKLKEINLKVTKLFTIVNQINELSNQVRVTMKDDLYSGMMDLSKGWTGDTAKDFLDKSNVVLTDTMETTKKITETSIKLVEIIKRYAIAEAAANGIQLNFDQKK